MSLTIISLFVFSKFEAGGVYHILYRSILFCHSNFSWAKSLDGLHCFRSILTTSILVLIGLYVFFQGPINLERRIFSSLALLLPCIGHIKAMTENDCHYRYLTAIINALRVLPLQCNGVGNGKTGFKVITVIMAIIFEVPAVTRPYVFITLPMF